MEDKKPLYSSAISEALSATVTPSAQSTTPPLNYSSAIKEALSATQPHNILDSDTQVTQAFGNENPNVEVFSNGFNSGTDLAAPVGTGVNLPPGKWQVLDAYGADQTPGHIGDGTNKGYGNSVLVENTETGEKMRFSHLSEENVTPGQTLTGGAIGKTGVTGNTTGPHLDLEYYKNDGQLGDVLQSPYAGYLPVIR